MGAVKPMVRLPSTNSRIWSNVSRSMFCMMMFIHPQHDTFLRLSRSGSPRIGNNLPLRARPALETNHPFRLIPHWIILGLDSLGSLWYGYPREAVDHTNKSRVASSHGVIPHTGFVARSAALFALS